METLFEDDPVFATGRQRDSRGRFATRERAMLDKTRQENVRYRLEAERYRRLAEEPTRKSNAMMSVIARQSETIRQLREELTQAKRLIGVLMQ